MKYDDVVDDTARGWNSAVAPILFIFMSNMNGYFYALKLSIVIFVNADFSFSSYGQIAQQSEAPGRWKRDSLDCGESQFLCSSGECVDAFEVCNGGKDCDDGSDEKDCEDFSCPVSHFRCKYGACVPSSSTCNGVKDCIDGSDETKPPCKVVATTNSKNTTQSTSACELPPTSADRSFNVTKDGAAVSVKADRKVPRYSNVLVTCKAGYTLHNKQKSYRSICDAGQWLPTLKSCLKICPSLHPTNAYITCHQFGLEIDCRNEMINGTKVRPRCKEYHTEEREVDYREITCMENGEWDNQLYKCVLACGSPHTTATLIAKGEPSVPGDTPWHVAIYRIPLDYLLICSGTLISPRLVLSAAHCFYDEGLEEALDNVTEYEIVVGKYSRDYNKTDNSLQKRHKIKELIFSARGYNPNLTGHHGGDIIVVVLEQAVTIGMYVLPVCVAWNSDLGFNPGEGTTGRLAGWGLDDKLSDTGTERLMTVDLPYISYKACVGQLQHITLDKFCAGSQTGAGARKGDSGGGLVFRNLNNNRYYLRGIVSTADKESNSSVATFTDISYYLDWIKKVRARVDGESSPKKLPGSVRLR